MRFVADTNPVISGLLWSSTPRQVLDAALATVIEPAIISPVIAADLDDDAVLACALALLP